MNLRGWLIVAGDAFDHWVLRHRIALVCQWVGNATWWAYVPDGGWYQRYWRQRWERYGI